MDIELQAERLYFGYLFILIQLLVIRMKLQMLVDGHHGQVSCVAKKIIPKAYSNKEFICKSTPGNVFKFFQRYKY